MYIYIYMEPLTNSETSVIRCYSNTLCKHDLHKKISDTELLISNLQLICNLYKTSQHDNQHESNHMYTSSSSSSSSSPSPSSSAATLQHWPPVQPSCRQTAVKVSQHQQWVLHNDILYPPELKLSSCNPLWTDADLVDISCWLWDDWSSASVINHQTLIYILQALTSLGDNNPH